MSEKLRIAYDDESGMYGVFGQESGTRYEVHATIREAARAIQARAWTHATTNLYAAPEQRGEGGS